METEFKQNLKDAEEAIDKLENKVEDMAGDLADDASELWADLKKSFSVAKEKLKTAATDIDSKSSEAQLQAHLGAMEAHDRMDSIKETLEEFTQKVSSKAQTELDTAKLRAHLAEMEAEDFWEKKGKSLTAEFNQSSDKIKEATLEATGEVKNYFDKLVEKFNKAV